MASVFPTSVTQHSSCGVSRIMGSSFPLVDKSGSNLPFPYKLHQLLEDAEYFGITHIISWLPGGDSFRIHDMVAFADVVMGNYFKQSKIKSFTRQLYIYGFSKLTKGPYKGGFFHPQFRRNNQKACMTLKRRDGNEDRRAKQNRPTISSRKDQEPSTIANVSCWKQNTAVASDFSHPSTSQLLSQKNQIPSSLRQGLRHSFQNPTSSASQSLDGSTSKKSLTLFDEVFGDDLNTVGDEQPSGLVTFGPISSVNMRPLAAPPSILHYQNLRPLQRKSSKEKTSRNSSAKSVSDLQTIEDPFDDTPLIEPHCIEDMFDLFSTIPVAETLDKEITTGSYFQ